MNRKVLGSLGLGGALLLLVIVLAIPILVVGGMTMLFAEGSGTGCTGNGASNAVQPGVSTQGKDSIPANYLHWYQAVGKQYGVSWTILAGIGTAESDNGRSTLPGVHSGQNGFGAAGPMQIGIGGASTNTWGGAAVHAASETVAGVATDEDNDGVANVYDPADAIAGAAKYLIQHGVKNDPSGAIFAYNHLTTYVTDVETYASDYASGGFTVSQGGTGGGASQSCTSGNGMLAAMSEPNSLVATAVNFAEEQIGKPYLWGGTGPDSFDCSGLVMMAYRSAGINIARTSQEQWTTEQRISASDVEPGDLVFFAGADGTSTAPGHVGLVIGKNTMIEAYATGFPVRVSQFGTGNSAAGEANVVGFTRPWAGAAGTMQGGSTSSAGSAGSTGVPGSTGSTGSAGVPGSGTSTAAPGGAPSAPGGPATGGPGLPAATAPASAAALAR